MCRKEIAVSFFSSHVPYRVCVLLLALAAQTAHGAGLAVASAQPLSLDEAVRLALTDQPLLTGREATIEAEEQRAIAARQLPDPKLSLGLKDVPIETGEAFSLRRDNFTEVAVGISQDFPRAEKRRLLGERKQLDADAGRSALDDERRLIGRDTALAWIDVYEAVQGRTLARGLADENGLQVQALEKSYANGRASQADWLAARVEAGLADDTAHDWQQRTQRKREGLARWIGEAAADRPLTDSPTLPPVDDKLSGLLVAVDHHPSVDGVDKRIAAAATDISLARQAYASDFSVEGYYAYRQDFADFVGVQVSFDLPFFTRERQDRALAAALDQSNASTAQKRDLLRELHASVRQTYLDWQHYRLRVGDFERAIIPDAQRRVDAARSAYAAGSGNFDAVLLARRGLLDVQLRRLALFAEAARAQIRLAYLTANVTPAGDAP
jgi:outer membrane protein TolC